MVTMSSDNSEIIKVVAKFLDPNSVKIDKLEKIEDILKLPIISYKFLDKEESTIIKDLFEISKIKELLKLDKEDPFQSLTILDDSEESLELAENKFEVFPEVIAQIKSLKYLSMTNNQLKDFPELSEDQTELTTIYLSLNELEEIPDSISNLTALITLYLDNNKMILQVLGTICLQLS